MSISSVSSVMGYPRTGGEIQWQQEMHDYQALALAIQSGDITSVLKAFAAWQQDLQAISSANTQTAQQSQPFGANTQANSDFHALSSAVKTGDLSGVQTAFASLQKDLQVIGGTHYRQIGGGAGDSSNNTSSVISFHSTATSPAPQAPLDNLA